MVGLMMTEEELLAQAEAERRRNQQVTPIWPENNPVGTETVAPPGQELRAAPPAPSPWSTASGVWDRIKTGASAIGGLLTADVVTPTMRAFTLPGVDLPADAQIEQWDAGPMVRLADGRLVSPDELPKRGAVIPRQLDPATNETSWAFPGLLDVLPALGSEGGMVRPVAEGTVLGAGARGGKAAAKAASEAPPAVRKAVEAVSPPEVVVPPAKAKRKPPAEMQGPPWRPLGEPPDVTPGAPTELPPLDQGLLVDPVKAARAREGATLGMTPEQYDTYLAQRGGLLDPGVAKLIRPTTEKGRAGTMASTPSLRSMTVDDAITTARAEPHIIEKPDGGFVGAPHAIRTREDIQRYRDNFDASVERGGPGSDWYLRVKAYADELSGRDPVAGRQLAEELALFSAQSDPYTNLGFAQQARGAAVRGEPSPRVRTGQQAERFNEARAAQDEAIASGQRFPNMQEGNKTGIFRQHMDVTADAGTTGTNDIWHARAFGFVDPKTGKPWDKALSQSQHSWLDYETMLAVDRANAKKLGGRSDWTPAEIQAAPWVAEKAASLEKRFKIPPEEAFARAKATYPDFAPHYTMDAPFEQVPGGNTGLTTGLMSPAEWQAASRRVDPGGLDPAFRNMGLNQRAVTPGTGVWVEDGVTTHNPVDVARPMVDFRGSGAKREIHPGTLSGLEATMATRGLTDFQIGSPATYWDTRAGSNARNGIKIEIGRGVTETEAKALDALGKKHGLGFANTGTGAGFMNFGENEALAKGTAVERLLKKGGLEAEIAAIVPGAKVQRAAPSGPYVDYGDRLAVENQGKGLATRMLDEKLQAAERAGAPGMVKSLLDDPNEVVKAQQNLNRLQASGQLGVRQDYERYLRLLSEERLRGLMEWARANGYRGLPVAAGGVALGGGLLDEANSREPGT